MSRAGSWIVLFAVLLSSSALAQESTYELPNERRPQAGWIFAAQPTAEQLEALARDGYRILDLRTESENRGFDEATAAARLGIDYSNVPVSTELLRDDAEIFARVFAELERAPEQPLLVHCASGNRVGALYYAWLVAHDGVAPAEAQARARANGLASDALVALVDAWLAARTGDGAAR